MATIPDLIRLYLKGFKQLFFYKGEKGERGKLSILKILIFMVYILAFVFAFLQFAEGNVSKIVEENYEIDAIDRENYNRMFPLSIYGELALLINLTILLGVIYFLLVRDKPLTKERITTAFKQVQDLISLRWSQILPIIVIVLVVGFVLSYSNINFESVYDFGKGMNIIWFVISPILVFNAFLVNSDVLAQDHPRLMKGFNSRLILFFFISLIVAGIIFWILPPELGIFVPENEPLENAAPIPLEGFEGVSYFEFGVYWMMIGLTITLTFIFSLIAVEIIVAKKSGTNEIRERRKANLLFLFPFIVIFIILQTLPIIFTFGLRLKALNNVIDLLNLLVLVFFAIFRVLTVQETPETQRLTDKNRLNPQVWLNSIPAYCKALFLLYLALSYFYVNLESNLILTLYGVQNMIKTVRINIVIGTISTALVYVFWRYKPITVATTPKSIDAHLVE